MAACCTEKISGSRQHRSGLITTLERANLLPACNIRPGRSRRTTQRCTFGNKIRKQQRHGGRSQQFCRMRAVALNARQQDDLQICGRTPRRCSFETRLRRPQIGRLPQSGALTYILVGISTNLIYDEAKSISCHNMLLF